MCERDGMKEDTISERLGNQEVKKQVLHESSSVQALS